MSSFFLITTLVVSLLPSFLSNCHSISPKFNSSPSFPYQGRESREMDIDLITPKKEQAVFVGDGGSYSIWSSLLVPALANVGACRLVLQPQGFALIHYGDSAKFGIVLQGNDGIAGIVLPNADKEVVLKLKKGDVIPTPRGSVSWWFNNGDSDELNIVFLGDTSQGYVPGQFTYFILSGTLGFMAGFSSELITKAYNLTPHEANKFIKSQRGSLIIKLQKGKHKIPEPDMDKTKNMMVYNIDAAEPDPSSDGGLLVKVKTLTESEFPFLGQVGLSVISVKLEPNAVKAPLYLTNPSVQLIYIARGSGKIEIVGLIGKSVLNSQVEAGHMVIVPKFYVAAQIAGEEGMEFYSMVTTNTPVFEELAGKSSIWRAISPQVRQAALNVDPHFDYKLFSFNTSTN